MTALAGRRALVTGGSRGIGYAIAAALIDHGADVTITGQSEVSVGASADALGAHGLACDVSDPDSVARAFDACGVVDILVNNAGTAESAPFKRTDLALWQRMINVNLTGTYLCAYAVVPGMVERGFGRIINIASTAALKGYPYVTAYCAAKHGVIGLTRALALELAGQGVCVNAVCPGYTDTDMTATTLETIVQKTGRTRETALAELVKHNPQGRLILPEEVAHTVAWLCLPGSDAITGQAIAVSGGETA